MKKIKTLRISNLSVDALTKASGGLRIPKGSHMVMCPTCKNTFWTYGSYNACGPAPSFTGGTSCGRYAL